MYQISVTTYPENNGRTLGVSSKEVFDELISQIMVKFSDSKIDWNTYMSYVSTGKHNVYEIDLEQRSNEGVWSMVEHHEFLENPEIISFLRNNSR